MKKVLVDGISIHEVDSPNSLLLLYVHQDQARGTVSSFFEYLKQSYRELNTPFCSFDPIKNLLLNEQVKVKGRQQVLEKKYDDQWRRDSIIAQELRVQQKMRMEAFQRQLNNTIKNAAQNKLKFTTELSNCAQHKVDKVFELKRKTEEDAERIWEQENAAHFIKHNLDRTSKEISYPNSTTFKYYRRDKEARAQQLDIRRNVAKEFIGMYQSHQFDQMEAQFQHRYKVESQNVDENQNTKQTISARLYTTQYQKDRIQQMKKEQEEAAINYGRSIIYSDCNPQLMAQAPRQKPVQQIIVKSETQKQNARQQRQLSAISFNKREKEEITLQRQRELRAMSSRATKPSNYPLRPQSVQLQRKDEFSVVTQNCQKPQTQRVQKHNFLSDANYFHDKKQILSSSKQTQNLLEQQQVRVSQKLQDFHLAKLTVQKYDKLKVELTLTRPGTATYEKLQRQIAELGID